MGTLEDLYGVDPMDAVRRHRRRLLVLSADRPSACRDVTTQARDSRVQLR